MLYLNLLDTIDQEFPVGARIALKVDLECFG